MKRVFAITFLNYFVSGGLALTIPLLLLERNVNLAEIGIVISILPLVFLSVRLLFAAVADQLGWSLFFILINWPGTFFSTATYLLANSTNAFMLGKIIEGIKESSFWAVIRTATFSLSPEQEEKQATRISGVLALSVAIGSAVAGLGIGYLGFSTTLSIMIMASAIIGIPASLLWRAEKKGSELQISSAIAKLDPRSRGRTFWLVSLTILFYSLARYPLVALLLPVFMAQQLGYNYTLIGISFMLYNVIVSSVTFSALKIPLEAERAAIQSLIGLFAVTLLTNSGVFFPALLLALACAHGLGTGFFESIIAKATKNRLTVSVDIGLLHIPMRLAEFASVLCAGFVAQSFGFTPIFIASGIFFVAFSVLSLYALKTSAR